jgi:hypothetical protein
MIGSRALLAAVVGAVGLPVGGGCGDSNKSDGQIQQAPEAAKAAAEAGKSISANMDKAYANKMQKKQ